jgi:drug/metabolite transporter (DMT)-like permease
LIRGAPGSGGSTGHSSAAEQSDTEHRGPADARATDTVSIPLAPGSAQPALLSRNHDLPVHPRPSLLYLAVGVMVVTWTLNLPVGKVALISFPPLLLISIRSVLAAGFILPVYLWANPYRRRIALGDFPGLILVCLCGQIGNQVLFVIGLNYTSVAHTAFIFSLVPILILLLAAWVGHEHVTGRKLIGMAISATGVVLLSLDKANGGGPTLFGDALCFVSACLFSFFTVMSKPYRNRYGPVTVSTFSYVSGAIALLPVVLYFLLTQDFRFDAVVPAGWAAVIYMAVFPAVIGYIIYYYALGYIAASRLSAFNYLQPPLATAIGVLFLGEPLTSLLLISGTMILVGVAVTERG